MHCCESMNVHLTGEDLILVYDVERRMYLRPIFDGPPEAHFLGRSGISLNICPWSGHLLPGRMPNAAIEEVPLPLGVSNPRY